VITILLARIYQVGRKSSRRRQFEKALAAGAAVMLLSHLGRPVEGQYDEASSLKPLLNACQIAGKPVRLEKDWLDGIVMPGRSCTL